MINIFPIIITSIAGFSTILGNLLVFINIKYKDIILSFSMGLSFIVMFLISVLELIPEGILLVKNINIILIFILSILLLIVGYIIVIFIDNKIDSTNSLYRVGILSMISLLIHNIPEGMICAISSIYDIEFGIKMSLIIMLHNIPEGICISLPIYYSTKSRGKAIIYSIISGFGEVIGAIITMLFLKNFICNYLLYIIYLITGGIMITLSVTKILKEGREINCFKGLLTGIIVGLIIVMITI